MYRGCISLGIFSCFYAGGGSVFVRGGEPLILVSGSSNCRTGNVGALIHFLGS